MKVKVKVYDGVKYWDGTQKVAEVNYDIQGYEVKQIPDEEIAAMGFDTVDEFEEYLILTLKSGETSTSVSYTHLDELPEFPDEAPPFKIPFTIDLKAAHSALPEPAICAGQFFPVTS